MLPDEGELLVAERMPKYGPKKKRARARKDYSDLAIIMAMADSRSVPDFIAPEILVPTLRRLGLVLGIHVGRAFLEAKHALGAGKKRLISRPGEARVRRKTGGTTPPRILISALTPDEFRWIFRALRCPREKSPPSKMLARIGKIDWFGFMRSQGMFLDSPDKRGFVSNFENQALRENLGRLASVHPEMLLGYQAALRAFDSLLPVDQCPAPDDCLPPLDAPILLSNERAVSYVYILVYDDMSKCKIGTVRSSSSGRFSDLAGGNPEPMHVYKITLGGYALEAMLKRIAVHDRIDIKMNPVRTTEWHRFTPSLRALFDRLHGPSMLPIQRTIAETLKGGQE